MRFCLSKIKTMLTRKKPDAEILGEVKFHRDNIPFFTIKMRGCNTLVDIDVEDIIEKFTEKFSSTDIKNATKIFMKYRSLLRLVSIEKNTAIIHNKIKNSYHMIDLSNNLFLHETDIDSLRSEDAFKLGVQFERMRLEKDRKLFNLTKSSNNISQLKLVKSNDK